MGTQHAIVWDQIGSNIPNVKIEYSTNSGSTYTSIINSETNDGSYTWLVPDIIQPVKNMKIRISTPAEDPWNVNSVSTGLFQVIGQLTMTRPSDATPVQFRVGSSSLDLNNEIKWTAVGTIINAKLEYSTSGDNGPWTTIVSGTPSGAGNKSYAWAIPSNVAIVKDDFRVRVLDAANTDVFDVSQAQSSMLANFIIVQPASGVVWQAENTHAITWTTPVAGTPANVKIEYSLNGSDWFNLPETSGTANDGIVPNSGSQNWTLGVNLSTSARVRISDPNNAANSLVVSDPFKIRGSLTLTAPNGLESFKITETTNITWTKKGNIATVKLEYSNNGNDQLSYVPLVDGRAVPLDTQNINAADGTFSWVIPNIPGVTSTTARIRVVDTSDGTVLDPSNGNFTVRNRVVLTQPLGGQTLTVGVPYTISGFAYGDTSSVNLFYSTNGGQTYDTPLGGGCSTRPVSASAFSCNWTVPDIVGNSLRVIAVDAADALVFDNSTSNFTVKAGATITSPDSNSVFIAGDSHNIVWNRTGSIGNVDFFYSVNDGTWNTIATGIPSPLVTGNTYSWSVPSNNIVSQNVKIKIDGTFLVAPYITSPFTVKGKLTLTYPDAAGIEFTLGNPVNVTWSVAGDIGDVTVEYFDGTSWSAITNAAPQSGPFNFNLDAPNTTIATNLAKIRISRTADSTVSDTSTNAFMVRAFLAVTSPVGNEEWVVNSSHNITWDKIGSNISNVELTYSTNNGSTFPNTISSSTANDGTHPWTVPDNIQSVKNMKVKVATLPLNDAWGTSATTAGLFQIVGSLQMVIPDDTTPILWRVGSSANEIKWNSTGSIINAKLEYSANSGSTWSTIVASTPSGAGNGKSYGWNIPANTPIVKDNFRIRVLDAANTNVFDIANAQSSMLANFAFTAPVQGNVWQAENSHTITWTTPVAGVPTNVKIQYNLTGNANDWLNIGENDGTANDGIVANTGTRSWTLPTGLSNVAKLRIADALDALSQLESNTFKIRGSLTLTSPDNLESWEIGTINNITWTKKGDITAVKFQLSTDSGANYDTLYDASLPTPLDTQNVATPGTGPYSFAWTIPNQAGISKTTIKVRVIDTADDTVYDSSNGDFTIKGKVSLVNPNGGATYPVNTPLTINGTVFGPIANVQLFYSTNGGSTYPTALTGDCGGNIAVLPNSTWSCNWTVPDSIGASIRIKAVDASNSQVFDTSDSNFAIKGSLTITSPIITTVWNAGDTQPIQWSKEGTIGNVDISYSNNGGTTWYPVLAGVASPLGAGNSADWAIPSDNIVSSSVQIKMSGPGLIADALSPLFRVKGKINITYPTATGIAVTLGDTLNITWTRFGDIGPVKVEYTTDDGSNWNTITTTAPQNGPFAMVLDAPNTTIATIAARVRISDADDVTVISTSANTFTVKPLIAFTSPVGGESWRVNDTNNVTWNFKASNVAQLKLEYSIDSGANYNVIAAATENDGVFPWQIPDIVPTATPTVKLRMTTLPESDPFKVVSLSNGQFKIVGGLSVTGPTASDKWGVASAQNIAWTRIGQIANVRIDYSTDNGGSWNQIATNVTGGAGSYPWNVPNVAGIVSITSKIRVSDVADATVNGISPTFSIVPSFSITSPVANQIIPVNKNFNITWSRLGQTPTVNIYYSKEDFAGAGTPIALAAANTGSYTWLVPDFPEIAGGPLPLKVRVAYPADELAESTSSFFQAAAGFTVLSPNGPADKWNVQSQQAIIWTSTSTHVAQVRIKYSVDGGTTYPFTLTSNADNTGAVDAQRSWVWNSIPDTISASVKVRVEDKNDAAARDDSDANSKIKARFEVLTPSDTGINMTVANTYNITWDWSGSVSDVVLSYSRDDFATQSTINGGISVPNNGLYVWTIPDDITQSSILKVKVRSNSDQDAFDISDNGFKIHGHFTLTKPNGTDRFRIGLSDTIEWTTVGNIPNVKIVAYSTLAGDTGFPYTAAAPLVIRNSVANTPNGNSVFTWTPIPNLPTSHLRVQVSDVNDVDVFDNSDADFRIQGQVTITNPLFTAIPVGSMRAITWTWGGNIPRVKIEYSADNGPYVPIQENEQGTANDGVVTNDGTFNWSVPDAISNNVKVRIRDPNDAEVESISNQFKIYGTLEITSPNGGERWIVNENPLIEWNQSGTLPKVKLEYSINGGTTWLNVTEADDVVNDGIVTNNGSFTWNVPNILTTNAMIRISDPNDPTQVADVSNNPFQIDYYYITWVLKDLLTNINLDQLTVASTDGWIQSGLISPIVHGHPAGAYVAKWSRPEYGELLKNFVADQDQTITIFMETQVVHIWEAVTDMAYNADLDRVSISSTLRRDGGIVTGAVGCTVSFYDAGTKVKEFVNNGPPDAQGFYNFTWASPTGLQAGKVYNVVTSIPIATGGTFNTPRTFSITEVKKLQDVQTAVENALDTPLSAVRDAINTNVSNQLSAQNVVISTKLDEQSDVLEEKLDEQTTIVSTKLDNQTNIIQTQMNTLSGALVSLEQATVDIRSATEELETTGRKFSGRLLLPQSVLLGEDLTVRYRGLGAGLVPLMKVINSEGVSVYNQIPMPPSAAEEGLYEFIIPNLASNSFPPGQAATIMVSESTTGNFEVGSVAIEATSLTAVQGMVASSMGTSAILKKMDEKIDGLNKVLGGGGYINEMLQSIKTDVEKIPAEIAQGDKSSGARMATQLNQVAKKIDTLAGDEGMNLSELMQISVQEGIEQAPGMREVRQKTDKIQGAIEIVQEKIEKELIGDEAPILKVIYS